MMGMSGQINRAESQFSPSLGLGIHRAFCHKNVSLIYKTDQRGIRKWAIRVYLSGYAY